MMVCIRTIAATVLALGVLAALPARPHAQEMSLAALIDRLDRIERDLGGVQRQLAREGVPPAAAAGAAGDPQAAARVEVRMTELEEQFRTLTGAVEEAQHGLRQLVQQYDSLSRDVDARLAAIEQRLAAGAPPLVAGAVPPAGAAPAGLTTPGSEGTTTVVDAGGTTVVGRDANADRYETMGVLGTVPTDEGSAADAAAGELAAVSPAAAAGAPASTPEGQYEDAYRLLAQADYDGAEAALQAFIADHPDHPLVGNAYYWLGETYYVRNDYQEAAVAFARGYKGAPDGSKAADNLLKLGMSFTSMDKTKEACATFDKLLHDHAGAPAQVLSRVEGERSRAGCS